MGSMTWVSGSWGGTVLTALVTALVCLGSAPAQADTLQVRRISPLGKNVQPAQEAVIQFDRAMVSLGAMAAGPSPVGVRIRPDPGCQWRWLDTTELACRLSGQQHFAPATRYTVTVGTVLKALDGSHLAAPKMATFTTWRPTVEWSHFEQWRAPATPMYRVRFNLPVTSEQAARHVGFVDGAGKWVRAKAEPFTKKRKGPIWLPVPGAPGAVLEVKRPSPDTPLDIGRPAAAGRRIWRVLPVTALAAATDYKLRVKPGLRSPLGSLTGKQDKVLGSLRTYGSFTFAGVGCRSVGGDRIHIRPDRRGASRCAPDDVDVLFSAPVPRATLAAIRWQPAPLAKSRLAATWRDYPQWYLRDRADSTDADQPDRYPLTFDLEPVSRYTLTVPAGVEDRFGRRLAKPVSVTFQTRHRTPFFDPPPTDAVLETGEPTIVPLRFTNLSRLGFDFQRLTASQLAAGRAPAAVQSEDLLVRPDLPAIEDRIVRGNLGIRDLLGGGSGVVWGKLGWVAGKHKRSARFTGQVTPWQVFAKLGHYDSQVWVGNLDSNKLVASARVQLLLGHRGKLDHLTPVGPAVTTDASGLAVLPGTAALPKAWFSQRKSHSDFYVSVTRGHDMALLPLQYAFRRSVMAASHYSIHGDTAPPHGHMRAWALTEQGIYKPGGDVKYAVFARAEGATTLRAPPAVAFTLVITDPQGNEIFKREHLKLSDYGDVHGQLQLPATAAMGRYELKLSWSTSSGRVTRDAGHFLVTDFVPAAFKVTALVKGSRFAPGDRVRMQAGASLHAGGPYADAVVKFTTRLVPQRFSPDTPVAAGFRFGTDEALPQAQTLAVTKGRLDHAGHAHAKLALPTESKVIFGSVNVEAAVKSARGTWVAGRASVPYAARGRFVGLRTSNWMQQATQPFKVVYLVVDTAGQPTAGSPVTLELQRRSITRVRVKNGAGDFTFEEHHKWVTEDHCKAISTAAPGHCELKPRQAGRYRVLATVIDGHGREQRSLLSTWVTGAGRVVWSRSSKGVTLVPDKSSYQVGDVAHVLVQNPYPGAHALVTVERYGSLWKEVVTLKGSAPVIDVPISADCYPGAYLSVAIFSPRVAPAADPDLGRPELALGYMALNVTGHGSALGVAVTPAQSEYKPRQTVEVDVAVHAQDGTPAGKTRLVVAVVDQGVLDLLKKGADYYDPRVTFYAPPAGPDVTNYSLAEQLLTRLQPKVGKGESPGGGGGASIGPNVRRNFQYATYWNPTLETDATGHAHFSFKLPDNLGRWRILVVAMSPGAAMGLGDGSVRVNLPLQIQPALPNQMHVGDDFGAAFDVTNRTDSQTRVTTHIEASGAIDGGKAESEESFDLGSFARHLSWLSLVATRPGDIALTASARSGKLADAVAAHIPVRRAGTAVVAAQYGSTTGRGAQVPIKVPADAVNGKATLEVIFAPTLVAGLDGAFEVMRTNPLRTWEIRLSRSVLASDYLRLKPVLGDGMKWPDARHVVDDALVHAADFQAPSGGMAYWIPRNKFVSPYLSVYTALAFDWLAEAGHAVPARVEARLWKYLQRQIVKKTDNSTAAPVLRAGVMAALAMSQKGKLPDGAVAGMLPRLHQLSLFGQALLLDAAVGSTDRTSGVAIVDSLLSHAEESAGQISFNARVQGAYVDLLATPLRSNCAILDALSRYKAKWGDENRLGTTPQKLMRWVTGQRRNAGGWPNSQENVFCTTAIAHFADVYEKTPVKALGGQFQTAGHKSKLARFASRATPAVKLGGAAPEAGRTAEVQLHRSGQGRLYYNVQLHYVMPPDALPAADAGMTLARHYYVQRGGEWMAVKPGGELRRGDIVRVDLDIDTPTERHHVVLTDPLPGAFEAVNRLLASAPQTTPARQPGVSILMFGGGAWPSMSIVTGGFYHRETSFDAVRFFADDLPAGHYRVVYAAQVVAPGTFIAPAPTVKEIYQPDVFGRGKAQHLGVVLPGR